jgi:AcrR family transcriptional regulator
MPRQPDPQLEEKILRAAQSLWRRGGEKSLTLRAVARAAGTNTPAVYRRFRNRRELVRGLLLRTAERIGKDFRAGKSLEDIAQAYIDLAIKDRHDFELFYSHAYAMRPPKEVGKLPLRAWRPNFGLLEDRLAQRLGGSPQDHTLRAMALWETLHGTSMLLLAGAATGHEQDLLRACRQTVKMLLDNRFEFGKGEARHGSE